MNRSKLESCQQLLNSHYFLRKIQLLSYLQPKIIITKWHKLFINTNKYKWIVFILFLKIEALAPMFPFFQKSVTRPKPGLSPGNTMDRETCCCPCTTLRDRCSMMGVKPRSTGSVSLNWKLSLNVIPNFPHCGEIRLLQTYGKMLGIHPLPQNWRQSTGWHSPSPLLLLLLFLFALLTAFTLQFSTSLVQGNLRNL